VKSSAQQITLTLLICLAAQHAYAQCTAWKWPTDKAKAEAYNRIYTIALKKGNYKEALVPHHWLLSKAPSLHISLYSNGVTLYDKLATKTKDPLQKQVYIDSLMILYDLRMQYCGEEAAVINRKALASYRFNVTGSKANEVLAVMDRAFELNGNKVMDSLLLPYMQTIRINALKLKTVSEEQLLQRYAKISSAIDAKIARAKSEGKPIDVLVKTKSDVDDILITIVKLDCDFIRKNLVPKFRQKPDNLGLAQKIFSSMLKGKCTEDALWLEAGEVIYASNKDVGLANMLAVRYLAKDSLDKAAFYFTEALALETEVSDKVETVLMLGSISAKKDKKKEAREFYQQAIVLDPGNKAAFAKIGDLYYQSFGECAKKETQANDRMVYSLAYDYYVRAGEGEKMETMKALFPSNEENFAAKYLNGQTIKVGCWINESTTIRTRDE
jgi:tetratricopeptide (TPR) repeat protein